MDWLQILVPTIVGVVTGASITYLYNVRLDRKRNEQAIRTRLQGLTKEIESNLLLLNSGNLTGHGGKPRLLIDALQRTQDDWFTLQAELQTKLQKLYAEISIFNIKVGLFLDQPVSSKFLLGTFFENKPPEINKCLKDCKKDLDSYLVKDK